MNEVLRIVHVVQTAKFAGVERHVATLAAAQHDAGHRVAVVGGEPERMQATIGREGVLQRPAATTIAAMRALDGLARCDVLHVHMTAAEIAVLLSPKLAGVPVVSTRHFGRRRSESSPARLLAPAVRRRLAGQLAISRYVAQRIDGASTVVYPGVPVGPDAVGADARRPVVLLAQRLAPEKRTDVGLRVFAASGLAREGWRLDVAGDGGERPALESLAADLGIAHVVRFLGRRSDVARLMDRSSILLAPCAIDGLGLSVVEAMAGGLPVVAAGAGGHLETIGAVPDAALFDAWDPIAGGQVLGDLARDVARREVYSRAEQAVQRRDFTVEAQQRATDEVYRSVL